MSVGRAAGLTGVAIVLVLTASTLGSLGQSYKDGLRCTSPEEPADRVIHFCSKVIDGGEASREQLALAHYHRGRALAAEGEHSEAISDFNQAMTFGYGDSLILCDRGNSYGALGQYDKAAADCQRAAEENPNESAAWASACKWYRRDAQPTEAEAACAKAKALDPNCEVCTSAGVTIME